MLEMYDLKTINPSHSSATGWSFREEPANTHSQLGFWASSSHVLGITYAQPISQPSLVSQGDSNAPKESIYSLLQVELAFWFPSVHMRGEGRCGFDETYYRSIGAKKGA